MLAHSLNDPDSVESNLKSISGLGLLDMTVTFKNEKTTTQVKGEVVCDEGIFSGLMAVGSTDTRYIWEKTLTAAKRISVSKR